MEQLVGHMRAHGNADVGGQDQQSTGSSLRPISALSRQSAEGPSGVEAPVTPGFETRMAPDFSPMYTVKQ